jgi:aspartate/methionine/tyrosine aminotransferase
LDEDKNWALDVADLKEAVTEARSPCNPTAIVIINPGNPTGQVLTEHNIRDIIRFAQSESLLIMADEVRISSLIFGQYPMNATKTHFDEFVNVLYLYV